MTNHSTSIADELEKLAELKEKKVITHEQFEAHKKALLKPNDPQTDKNISVTPSKKMSPALIFVLIVFGVFFSIVVSSFNSASSIVASNPAPVSSVNFDVIDKAINDFKTVGLIKKVDVELNEVYVRYYNWSLLNIDDKQTAAKAMAYYVGHHKGTNLYWVNIMDYQTGAKLAKYSDSWGYTAY